ncbi:MAG: hypothetical protein M3362_02730 [Acidobacteriota bacterium]|nr:hypothetical protein [Acidobacteriota bacterium]
MPRRRKKTDEKLKEQLNDPVPERPLRGHQIMRMLYMGRIPPGEYRYETESINGRREIETFEADEDGRVKNLKIWVEKPGATKSRSKKQGARTKKAFAKKRAGRKT